ncbi:hypothetical protein AYO39_01130 [Actinobacteria bacterium SCGC AG-212-D09]|nr:hypothetical protein AYO39_01130 [Actinobacteria bacterium SCGC AG-212-D09]
MESFEEQLWDKLVREHEHELTALPTPAAKRQRTGPLALTGGVLATLATVFAFALGAASTTPAFAVTARPDGAVTVTLHEVSGIAGLNAELARRGIRARAVPVRHDCHLAANNPPGENYLIGNGSRTASLADTKETFYPGRIPADRWLALGVIKLSRDKTQTVQGLVTSKHAPTCVNDLFVTEDYQAQAH